jgi:hypothetical protein
VYSYNPVVYDCSTSSCKPIARWTSIRLAMVYCTIVLYRLVGVLNDPPELGGGYMKNSVSFMVLVVLVCGHTMGFYQMKGRHVYTALYNTMINYEISTSGGKSNNNWSL